MNKRLVMLLVLFGAFTAGSAFAQDDNYEQNDTRLTAYDLTLDEATWLSDINGYGIQWDEDWYEIEVTASYLRVLIDCQFSDAAGDIDIELYDSTGTYLTDSASTSDDEWIDYTVSAAGTYYILVYWADAGNTYDLWWDDMGTDDNYELNNSLGAATDLTLNEGEWLSEIAGYGIKADEDWYEIEVTAGYELVQIDCRFLDDNGDIDMQLTDSVGTVLATSASVTDNEYISYRVSGAGTYYIRLYFSTIGNIYDLMWDDVAPPSSSDSSGGCTVAAGSSSASLGLFAMVMLMGLALARFLKRG